MSVNCTNNKAKVHSAILFAYDLQVRQTVGCRDHNHSDHYRRKFIQQNVFVAVGMIKAFSIAMHTNTFHRVFDFLNS